jgi:FK506-binding nuclear protein
MRDKYIITNVCVCSYVGKLANGKVFDQSQRFSFRLGKGEVIKGWDIGFANMKLGAERTLYIHPSLAYGSKGVPKTIPGNATLIFDVKLLGFK